MINQLKSIKDVVQTYITKYPHLRDNDNELIANIWIAEMGGADKVSQHNGMKIMEFIATGKLSSPESIRRCRAKLQELYPELRGHTYKERQESGKNTQKEIKYL